MKLSTKVALILACVLIVAGAALFFGAANSMGFDLKKASMTPMITKTYDITEGFSSIQVNGAECSINILPSEVDSCKVVLLDSEKIYHGVSVSNGVLTINRWEDRSWLDHFGLYLYPLEVNIYLPQKQLDNIYINVASGSIHIENITCRELNASAASGHIFVWNSYADTVDLKTVSGKIGFYNGDSKNITMKTVTGGIDANLQSGKTFDVHTTSGRITVPPDSSPDTCTATTVSGNIYITVE